MGMRGDDARRVFLAEWAHFARRTFLGFLGEWDGGGGIMYGAEAVALICKVMENFEMEEIKDFQRDERSFKDETCVEKRTIRRRMR